MTSIKKTIWTPRGLRNPAEQERRRAALGLPHVAPLACYAEALRQRPDREVADFDPYDGGTDARLLFLFEKPGPMTSTEGERCGSGFISRDNDDPSAEATGRFMEAAGIPRCAAVIWNVIPWWNGTIATTAAELREGSAEVAALLRLLPQVRSVVLVGRKAERAADDIRARGLALFRSAHPSRRVRASFPERWAAIPKVWREAWLSSQAD